MTQLQKLLPLRLKQLKNRKITMNIFIENHPMQKTYSNVDIEKLTAEISETIVALKAVAEFNKAK